MRSSSGEAVLPVAVGAGLFFPYDDLPCTAKLRRQVMVLRQAAVLALGMRWRGAFPAITQVMTDFCARPYAQRERLIEDPMLRIAVALLTRVGVENIDEARELVCNLITCLRASDRDDTHLCRVGDTDIIVHRYVVPDLLRRVSPPSYTFPERALVRMRKHAYTLEFFSEVCQTALRKIQATWPALHDDLLTYIKRLVHVPEATFRSCSAVRYAGVVFISGNDYSLVEVEESLVHEYGHQILYNVMEIDPLLADPNASRIYRLPWSGSTRDLYGYFHAFYIYVILACYYARAATIQVLPREADECAFCHERHLQIVHGLLIARDDFEPELFTPIGQELLRQLSILVENLAVANPAARQFKPSSPLMIE